MPLGRKAAPASVVVQAFALTSTILPLSHIQQHSKQRQYMSNLEKACLSRRNQQLQTTS